MRKIVRFARAQSEMRTRSTHMNLQPVFVESYSARVAVENIFVEAISIAPTQKKFYYSQRFFYEPRQIKFTWICYLVGISAVAKDC